MAQPRASNTLQRLRNQQTAEQKQIDRFNDYWIPVIRKTYPGAECQLEYNLDVEHRNSRMIIHVKPRVGSPLRGNGPDLRTAYAHLKPIR